MINGSKQIIVEHLKYTNSQDSLLCYNEAVSYYPLCEFSLKGNTVTDALSRVNAIKIFLKWLIENKRLEVLDAVSYRTENELYNTIIALPFTATEEIKNKIKQSDLKYVTSFDGFDFFIFKNSPDFDYYKHLTN